MSKLKNLPYLILRYKGEAKTLKNRVKSNAFFKDQTKNAIISIFFKYISSCIRILNDLEENLNTLLTQNEQKTFSFFLRIFNGVGKQVRRFTRGDCMYQGRS